ncbi:reverse transcriptase N-terminal domain-containing protein [Leptolyngbya sp. FACHB-671]|uniref:reverse transcriptase domain-containing protein n=1 Tax=Leptolyngbya sp. FACHB-671 TaxID=2692812 RepID=UPI0016839216|nr:reverse transcriptase domain-containing protein [Leptolyngbya sp. FACHB-671]MBD2070219.1 reverse transcriptase N-terminal domain-containing protein [Leptolyngbya sp. FACHB-671]
MNTVFQPMYGWEGLPWKRIQRQVFKLQTRIYRASCRGDVKAVHRLQRLLMKFWSAKCLAVRRVTQDNQGKKTAGIDGLASLPPKARLQLAQCLRLGNKAAPMRRVYIPKPGSKTEQRPLSIPTMHDRALQALVKLALEPEWEAHLEPNNYGYRPGRSCRDAIGAIFLAIKQKPKFVLDADIQKCFERINQTALLRKLKTFPSLARQIRAWLGSGIMDGETLYPTSEGIAQGGPLSPLLANVALHGMALTLNNAFKGKQRPMLVQYADDLVVLHPDLTVIQASQQILSEWLTGMGLELKPSKTRITHMLEAIDGNVGFDFLGYSIRQYRVGKTHSKRGFKTIIKPSKAAQIRHGQRLKEIIRARRPATQAQLIAHLNPVIRGWSNYYSTVCSKAVFSAMDCQLYHKLRAWSYRRHPHKSRHWIAYKYWRLREGKGWLFAPPGDKVTPLRKHESTPIRRHVKVQSNRSPYDGDWVYWSQRTGTFPTGVVAWRSCG